jgi:heme O synthase-like polyprenyltransferase
MFRTSQRPLVKGVNPKIALGIGAGLGTAGIVGLLSYNTLAGGIGASIWFSYLFIYTKMKQYS